MVRFIMQFTSKFLLLAVAVILMTACGNDKKEATSTAKAFLQAYYVDLDFEKALRLSSDNSHDAITEQAQMIALNPYAKEETPDIIFKTLETDPNNANLANYIYTCNRIERKLLLYKLNGKWRVEIGNGSIKTMGNSNFIQLPQGESNGFASASSGEIKYRKRRHGNSLN